MRDIGSQYDKSIDTRTIQRMFEKAKKKAAIRAFKCKNNEHIYTPHKPSSTKIRKSTRFTNKLKHARSSRYNQRIWRGLQKETQTAQPDGKSYECHRKLPNLKTWWTY